MGAGKIKSRGNRISWLDDADLPIIDEHVHQLEHFTASLADGVIDKEELEKQQHAVVAAMKSVEGELSDAVHAKVTTLLVELTALTTMSVLHEFAVERARHVFADA